jgi:hypothetical protein
VLGAAGEVFARSKPMQRDSLDQVVEWAAGGLDRREAPVVLRFTLRNACLYALWCQ